MTVGVCREHRLHPDVVDPAGSEVVLVGEALTLVQAQTAQGDPVRVVAEAYPADVADALLASLDHKAMEVVVAPAEGRLQSGVEVGDGAVCPDQEPAPDQRADAAQDVCSATKLTAQAQQR